MIRGLGCSRGGGMKRPKEWRVVVLRGSTGLYYAAIVDNSGGMLSEVARCWHQWKTKARAAKDARQCFGTQPDVRLW